MRYQWLIPDMTKQKKMKKPRIKPRANHKLINNLLRFDEKRFYALLAVNNCADFPQSMRKFRIHPRDFFIATHADPIVV